MKAIDVEITTVKTPTTFAGRLQLALDDPDYGMTQAELAKAVGYKNQSSISNILNDPARTGSSKTFQMAHALNIQPLWLADGTGLMRRGKTLPRDGAEIKHIFEKNTLHAPVGDNYRVSPKLPPVPLISWVIAGMLKEIDDIPDPEVGEWPLEYPSKRMSARSWALVVEGDSMDDGTERAIPAGHILFCDPEVHYFPNCLVIAKNTDAQRATFKQLITEDGKWYLKAWNKDSGFGVNGRLLIDDPALRVIAVVTRSRAPDRVH